MPYKVLKDTKYFQIQYDDSSTIPGLNLATSFSNVCDGDFEYMRDQWFGGISLFATKITLYITIPNDPNATCSIPKAGYNCWGGLMFGLLWIIARPSIKFVTHLS
ncbi:hypothetical protein COK36_27200 [Bacillus cereus]|uniref:hypothetical protein n=1 Tax=Bacillus cereus TaxID=1396 RepID=UPI000BF315D8|nr:hypothetical protein [Bacillus cereus]PEX75849.1 hypothetical protein CN462_03945 [Bacillus cereus]PFL22603.1 hypothetical protein COJ22_16755 [Bacillus cereus]PFR56946.1 hypothetical protein COK36_27200 [Bacillus cereus]PGW94853.1 hypothetical protein COE19_12120 [Bacillus cereus]PGY98364.1 hypothetical protein COE38_02700 [Bacillus cereus]